MASVAGPACEAGPRHVPGQDDPLEGGRRPASAPAPHSRRTALQLHRWGNLADLVCTWLQPKASRQLD
jgi:hypothetical protein